MLLKNKDNHFFSIFLFIVYFNVLFTTYIPEFSVLITGGKGLFYLIKLIPVVFGCFFLVLGRFNLGKNTFLFVLFLVLYSLSSFFFTNDIDEFNYLSTQLVINSFIFISLVSLLRKLRQEVCINTFLITSILLLVASLVIEITGIERIVLDETSLYQCGLEINTRFCGASNNPNALGASALMIYLFYIAIVKESCKARLILLCALFLAIMSGSRTTIFSILAGQVFLYFLTSGLKYSLRNFAVLTIIFLCFIFPIVSILGYEVDFGERFTIDGLINASGRGLLFSNALDYFLYSPFFGNGLDLNREYSPYWTRLLDNSFLNLLVSYGILGFLVFFGLVVLSCGEGKKINNRYSMVVMIFLVSLMAEERLLIGPYVYFVISLQYIYFFNFFRNSKSKCN